jgi:phospho-N-acetylmuramoyl-pentapeptide-transferase
MLYFFTAWLRTAFDLPGFGVFQYVTFRAAAATITALLISFIIGPIIIKLLKKKQIGEQAKQELQATGNHSSKAGTPTMGGLIVLAAVLIPTILWANIQNTYVLLIVLITVGLGAVGFLDDYLKVIKKMKKGLI